MGKDDPETPSEDTEEIAKGTGREHARVVRIPDAAHTLLWDQLDSTRERIRQFTENLTPEQVARGD